MAVWSLGQKIALPSLSVTHIGSGSQFIYYLHVSKFYRFSVCYDITGISITIGFLISSIRVAQITICWIKEKMVKFTIFCLVNIVAELLCIPSTSQKLEQSNGASIFNRRGSLLRFE